MYNVAALINPYARQSLHAKFLQDLEPFIQSLGMHLSALCLLDKDHPFEKQAQEFVQKVLNKQNVSSLIAVGGDGTVHLLANTIARMHLRNEIGSLSAIRLGAIGTGSSNDFHKPFTTKKNGIPYRLNFHDAKQSDLIHIKTDRDHFFGLNSFGVGFIAEANARFNRPSICLRALKMGNVTLAIAYTALVELLCYSSQTVTIQIDDEEPFPITLRNINLVKNPYISGSFHYEDLVKKDDGLLTLHKIGDCSKFSFLKIMLRLLMGKFAGSKKTDSRKVRKVTLCSPESFFFEIDGEVHQSNNVTVSVYPSKLLIAN